MIETNMRQMRAISFIILAIHFLPLFHIHDSTINSVHACSIVEVFSIFSHRFKNHLLNCSANVVAISFQTHAIIYFLILLPIVFLCF